MRNAFDIFCHAELVSASSFGIKESDYKIKECDFGVKANDYETKECDFYSKANDYRAKANAFEIKECDYESICHAETFSSSDSYAVAEQRGRGRRKNKRVCT